MRGPSPPRSHGVGLLLIRCTPTTYYLTGAEQLARDINQLPVTYDTIAEQRSAGSLPSKDACAAESGVLPSGCSAHPSEEAWTSPPPPSSTRYLPPQLARDIEQPAGMEAARKAAFGLPPSSTAAALSPAAAASGEASTPLEASTLLATTILNRLICKYSKVHQYRVE